MSEAKKHIFYLQQYKRKAKKMMVIWVLGAQKNGYRVTVQNCQDGAELLPGTGVFYGITPVTLVPYQKVLKHRIPFYYIDNSYMGPRGKYFRVTKNRIQHTGKGYSNCWRFDQFKLKIKPWRNSGKYILVTLQSELYFKLLTSYTRDDWLAGVLRDLRASTDRPIMVREKPIPSLPHTYNPVPFEAHMKDAWAVVTHNSATAVQAILSGTPAIVTDPDCAIAPITTTDLSLIENPPRPSEDERRAWAGVLADNQWSQDEIRLGECLRQIERLK